MIPASQTSPCLGENRTLSKNALGFYAKMHKKLANYSQIFHVKHALSEVLKPEMFHAGKKCSIFSAKLFDFCV